MRVAFETAIVSYIEPEPGYARAFNEWYETDHFPNAVLAGPGVLGGHRFVATRACKDLRPPDGKLFGDPARGSYLAVAHVAKGRQPEWDEWVVAEMETIAAQGRLFAHREHIHTAVYRFTGGMGNGDPTGPAYSGVIASAGVEPFAVPLTAIAVWFELERTIVSSAAPPSHNLALSYVFDDPIEHFARLDLPAGVGFASPFLATVPGTDTYTEEL